MRRIARHFIPALAAISLLGAASCSTPKNITYFQDITSDSVLPVPEPVELRIQPDNRLSIIVKSKDATLSSLFNLNVVTNRAGEALGSAPEGMSTYTVTPEGYVDMPVLGNIKAAGMTRSELAAFIKGELIGRGLLKDPVVTVEIMNPTFSVLGEVNAPGRQPFNPDRITILQAIARAGDLGIQAKRENVKVLRKEADGMHTYTVDLTDMRGIAQSPAYYIQQDDIIYVEPNDIKKRQATVNGNNVLSWGFWVSVASLAASVAVLIVK